jgi:hypothetical protein
MPSTMGSWTPGAYFKTTATLPAMTLKPSRMIASSARPSINRKPSSSKRARSVVRTQPLPRSIRCSLQLCFEDALLAGLQRLRSHRIDDAQLHALEHPSDAAALGCGELAVIVERPSRHLPHELGRTIGGEHARPELFRERDLEVDGSAMHTCARSGTWPH